MPARFPGLSMATFQMLWGIHQQEMAAKQAHMQNELAGQAQQQQAHQQRQWEQEDKHAERQHGAAEAAHAHNRALELKHLEHSHAMERERNKPRPMTPKRPKRAVKY